MINIIHVENGREIHHLESYKHLPFDQRLEMFEVGVRIAHFRLGHESESLQKYANAVLFTNTARSKEQRQAAEQQRAEQYEKAWGDPKLQQSIIEIGNLEAGLF